MGDLERIQETTTGRNIRRTHIHRVWSAQSVRGQQTLTRIRRRESDKNIILRTCTESQKISQEEKGEEAFQDNSPEFPFYLL